MQVTERNDELKTRPVSSTFPLTEVPEIRDSRIEETSEAAIEQVRKKAGVSRGYSEHTGFGGSIRPGRDMLRK